MTEGAIKRVGNFLGISKLGQGIGAATRVLSGEVGKDIGRQNRNSEQIGKLLYAAKREKNPQKRARLLQLAKSLGPGTSATDIDPNLNLSNREVLGSATNVVLNVATPGAFKGGKAAIIGKNTLLGAGFGAASGLEKNRNTRGIVGSTVGGAVVGTALGAGSIALKGVKEFLGNKTPEWLMNKAVKPALQDLKKNVKYGSATLGKELLGEGVKGGPKRLLEIADAKLNQYEDQLQTILQATDGAFERDLLNKQMGTLALPAPRFIPLGSRTGTDSIKILRATPTVGRVTAREAQLGQFTKGRPLATGRFKKTYSSSGGEVLSESVLERGASAKTPISKTLTTSQQKTNGPITRDNVKRYVSRLKSMKAGTPGMSNEVGKIDAIINSMPESMTLIEANEMKRKIYNELRDPAYKLDAKLSLKASALKEIARGLKTEIENEVGGTAVHDINRKLSIYGRLENAITDQLARALKNNAFSLTDGLLLTAGAAGTAFSPDQQTKPLSLLLALAGIIGRHNSTALNTYGAQTLKKLADVGSGKLSQTLSGATQRGVLNLP